MSREDNMRDSVLSILSQLAEGEYQGMANLSGRDGFSAERIRHAIESYGHTLIEPPHEALQNIVISEVVDADERQYRAVTPLWTKQEGKSRLHLELGFREFMKDIWIPHIRKFYVA